MAIIARVNHGAAWTVVWVYFHRLLATGAVNGLRQCELIDRLRNHFRAAVFSTTFPSDLGEDRGGEEDSFAPATILSPLPVERCFDEFALAMGTNRAAGFAQGDDPIAVFRIALYLLSRSTVVALQNGAQISKL